MDGRCPVHSLFLQPNHLKSVWALGYRLRILARWRLMTRPALIATLHMRDLLYRLCRRSMAYPPTGDNRYHPQEACASPKGPDRGCRWSILTRSWTVWQQKTTPRTPRARSCCLLGEMALACVCVTKMSQFDVLRGRGEDSGYPIVLFRWLPFFRRTIWRPFYAQLPLFGRCTDSLLPILV